MSAAPVSVCTAPGGSRRSGSRELLVRASPPDSNSFHDQLRKVCSQSMWTAGFKGILVVPMSCKVGRAHVWSLKHPRNIRENCIVIQRKWKSRQEREICVMRCKHPIFNMTRNFSSGSRVDRPPAWPPSQARQRHWRAPAPPRAHGWEEQNFYLPLKDLTDQSKMQQHF